LLPPRPKIRYQNPIKTVSDSKTWEWIGKISVILGIIGSLYLLKERIFPNAPKLDAKYTTWDYALPPDVQMTLDDARTYCNTNQSNVPIRFGNDYGYRYSSFTHITIKNIGDAQAEQIELQLSKYVDGIVSIKYNGRTTNLYASSSLELGNLRPSDTVTVDIWSADDAISTYDTLDLIHYSTGTARLHGAAVLFGVSAGVGLIAQFCSDHILGILIITGWIVLMALLRKVRNDDDEKKDQVKEKVEEEKVKDNPAP
jgi:hypothetical protein